MSATKKLTLACLFVGALVLGGTAAPAQAWYGGCYPPAPVYVAPAPVYYPPPVYVAPPPVYYPAPAYRVYSYGGYYRPYYPTYHRRGFSFGFGYYR